MDVEGYRVACLQLKRRKCEKAKVTARNKKEGKEDRKKKQNGEEQ